MEKPKYHFEFGRLLSEGIKQTALARQESLQQTHQYLADELGYAVNTLYVWRRGEHLPDDPHAVAGLARIFVKAWDADQQWINNFLAKGEYGPTQAIEKLNQELFGAESLPEEWGGAAQAKKDSAPVNPLPEKADADLFTPPQSALPSEQPPPEAAHRSVSPFRQLIQAAPDWLAGILSGRSAARPTPATPAPVALFENACGDKGLDLAEQRLLVSTAFGAYFAGLLERDEGYINLKGQIEVQTRPEQAGLEPIQSLYWALQHPKGPRLVIIAAEGGMGKSTLAAKLIRCLFEENVVDMIVGDSAKNQQVDPVSGAVMPIPAGYYDPASFFRRLYAQLGLPDRAAGESGQVMVRNIQGRLEGRRALIFVDNLETVARGAELLEVIRQLTTRDCRAIITTRTISGMTQPSTQFLLVRLNPLRHLAQARDFLLWHIQSYAGEHPDLTRLSADIATGQGTPLLLDRTGGIPLLLQLVLSDVARFSWQHLNHLPHLFGPALLNFLYEERWTELENLGQSGAAARQILKWASQEQYRGKKITFERVRQWADELGGEASPQAALHLLQERFLIVNHDLRQGNFAVFPSLAEFLSHQRED